MLLRCVDDIRFRKGRKGGTEVMIFPGPVARLIVRLLRIPVSDLQMRGLRRNRPRAERYAHLPRSRCCIVLPPVRRAPAGRCGLHCGPSCLFPEPTQELKETWGRYWEVTSPCETDWRASDSRGLSFRHSGACIERGEGPEIGIWKLSMLHESYVRRA
jgi:hypothetical protein